MINGRPCVPTLRVAFWFVMGFIGFVLIEATMIRLFLGFDTFSPRGQVHVLRIDGDTATTDRETLDFIADLIHQDPKKRVVTVVGVEK